MEGQSEDVQLKLCEEYNKGHTLKDMYKWIVDLVLFLYTMDAFLIYKRLHRHKDAARFKLYQRSRLRMGESKLDRWRNRWRSFLRIILIYYCLKFTGIVLVQVALYTTKRRQQQQQHLITTSRSLTPTTFQPERGARGAMKNYEPDDSMLALISQLLGNPLISLTGVTIFLYSVIVSAIGYALLYLPHLYRIEPLDSVNLRLYMEPSREFQRIDIIVMETLDKFSQSFRRSGYCNLGNWRRHSTNGPHYALVAGREIQTKIINLFRRRFWQLRPILYTIQWYKAFDLFTLFISAPVVVIIVTFTVFIVRQLITFILSGKTRELGGFSFFETLTIIETICGLLLVIPIIMLLIIIFLCDCFSHLILLADTKLQLLTCLDELKHMSDHGNSIGEVDHLNSTCTLLRTFIKISLTLDELRSNAKFITQMVSVNMVISGTTCVFILLAETLDGQDLYQFRAVIIIGLWFWANLTLIGCAYIYKSASKLEKITWSMMAEILTRESRDDWLMFEFQVAEFWRRLVFSKSFSEPRLSVRPFGVTLTYDRALQLNFLAISFAGLLKTF